MRLRAAVLTVTAMCAFPAGAAAIVAGELDHRRHAQCPDFMETVGENRCDIARPVGDSAEARDSIATRSGR